MTDRLSQPQESTDDGHRDRWWNPLHWPAAIWVLVVAILIMIAPFAVRTVMLAGVPAMAEPFDVDEFVKWDVPADQDAFTDYRRASDMLSSLGQTKTPETVDLVLEQGWSKADEPLKQWMQRHQESLAVWRSGAEKAGGLNVSPAKLSFALNLKVIQDQRLFVKLALLEQARCIDAGQFDEAWQWGRAAFRCGGHSSHRGCLIQGLIGTAIHATSTNGIALWAEQPAVTSEQLRTALAAIQSDYGLYESRSNILKSEQTALCNSLTTPNWLQITGPATALNANSTGALVAMKFGYWVIGEPELTLRVSRQMLANQIREIDKPLVQRRKIVGTAGNMLFDSDPAQPLLPGELDAAGIDVAVQRSVLIRVLGPALKHADTAFLRQQARQVTTEILLAAQAHHRTHGEYPTALSQLVPTYLSALPVDPCHPQGAPICFRRDDPAKAVVWSVGDDGVDGGGDVESKAGRSADVGFVIKLND